MELGLGKRVISRDGHHVGQVDGLVLDSQTRDIDSFIVRSGVLLEHDRIVSRTLIDQIAPDGTVSLTLTAGEVHTLPEFLEEEFITAKPDELEDLPGAWVATGTAQPAVYWGTGSEIPTDTRGEPLYRVAPLTPPEVEVESNLPTEDVVIDTGTTVIGSDGRKLGNVDELVYAADGRVTGFVVRAGFLFHHDLTVPAEWIESIGEAHVRLRLTADQVREQQGTT